MLGSVLIANRGEIARRVITTARRLGIRVIEVDGSQDAAAIAHLVADHFSPYLPPEDPGT